MVAWFSSQCISVETVAVPLPSEYPLPDPEVHAPSREGGEMLLVSEYFMDPRGSDPQASVWCVSRERSVCECGVCCVCVCWTGYVLLVYRYSGQCSLCRYSRHDRR